MIISAWFVTSIRCKKMVFRLDVMFCVAGVYIVGLAQKKTPIHTILTAGH